MPLSTVVKSLLATALTFALLCSGLVPMARASRPNLFNPTREEPTLNSKTGRGVAASKEVNNALANMPMSFEANRGQADKKVKFLSRGNGYSLSLTATESILSLRLPNSDKQTSREAVKQTSTLAIRMKLGGASRTSQIEGVEQLPGKVNYFKGNHPSKWQVGIANYAKVRYEGVYPGIDLIYYGRGQELEYDFVVAPGADPKNIQIEFEGAEKLEVNADGDLILRTRAGNIHHRKPYIYQDIDGTRKRVAGRFLHRNKKQVRFEIGEYDPSRTLVIDPAIAYSTLLGGGSGTNLAASAKGIATYTAPDGKVYVYVVGITSQPDFPTRNAFQSNFGGIGPAAWYGDVVVAKFDVSVSGDASLLYSTYLGGGGNEDGAGIAVDSDGNAYLTGYTGSADFPVFKAIQSTFGGGATHATDAFVTALSANGSSLIYSTYLGGSQDIYGAGDVGTGIALDGARNAYITGSTYATDFPTVNAFQEAFQGIRGQAFVAKIAPPVGLNPATLLYSTYLGGSEYRHLLGDEGKGIAVDSSGNIYVTGRAPSTDFPIKNGFQTEMKCVHGNGFVAKINPSVSGPPSLLYSTYIGGSCDGNTQPEGGLAIAVDSSGKAYITGRTTSSDFPTTAGALMTQRRSGETGFVAKIDPSQVDAQSLVYSTYLGGTSFGAGEAGRSIAVDNQGNAYVAGLTHSFDFPLVNPTQSFNNGAYQSLNGGLNWLGLRTGLKTPTITALAVDTSTSPRTLYAGAANHYGGPSELLVSGGVFKSIDGGLSWNLTNNGLTTTDVKELAVSPSNPATVYAATSNGVFRTSDGGAAWNALNGGLSETTFTTIQFLTFDTSTNPATLYLGSDEGLHKITDGSNQWSQISFQTGARRMVFDNHTSPSTLYVLDSDLYLRRSTDGGTTWNSVDVQGSQLVSLGIDTATTPATLYAQDPYGEYFFSSTDGGNSWESAIPFSADNWARIVTDTTTIPSTIYLAFPAGGLVKTVDRGNTWTRLFSEEVGALSIDTTLATPLTPSVLYVGNRSFPADAFVAKLNSTGSTLLYSSCLGGYGVDEGFGLALDSTGNVYVAGTTQGDFPTVNAYQTSAEYAAFVVKLGDATLPSISPDIVTTELAVQTGILTLSFPNVTGSTSGTTPTATVNPLDSSTTADLTLSNNLGAYEIKTTATYNTSGYAADPTQGIKITFTVPTVNDVAVFNNLVISHGEDADADGIIQPSEMIAYNGTADPNKVTHHDFATRTVWVYVPSLSPFVITKGVSDQISDLISTVHSFNLRRGIENSLDAKLQNALQAYQAAVERDRPNACNKMGAFINEVGAQSGKALTTAQANQLTAAGNQIKVTLNCR